PPHLLPQPVVPDLRTRATHQAPRTVDPGRQLSVSGSGHVWLVSDTGPLSQSQWRRLGWRGGIEWRDLVAGKPLPAAELPHSVARFSHSMREPRLVRR